jgi:hypothetical protein
MAELFAVVEGIGDGSTNTITNNYSVDMGRAGPLIRDGRGARKLFDLTRSRWRMASAIKMEAGTAFGIGKDSS